MRLTFNIGTKDGEVTPLKNGDQSKLGTAQKAHFVLSRVTEAFRPGIVSGFSFREALGEYDGKPEKTIVITIDFELLGDISELIEMIAKWGADRAFFACIQLRQECISWELQTPGVHANRYGLEYHDEIEPMDHVDFSYDYFIR